MNKQLLTGLILAACLVGLIIYDAVAIGLWGANSTISSVVHAVTVRLPFTLFLAGFVCGHLFWNLAEDD